MLLDEFGVRGAITPAGPCRQFGVITCRVFYADRLITTSSDVAGASSSPRNRPAPPLRAVPPRPRLEPTSMLTKYQQQPNPALGVAQPSPAELPPEPMCSSPLTHPHRNPATWLRCRTKMRTNRRGSVRSLYALNASLHINQGPAGSKWIEQSRHLYIALRSHLNPCQPVLSTQFALGLVDQELILPGDD